MKKFNLLVLSFFLLVSFFAFSQEKSQEPTVEELYLQNTEIRLIKEQAASIDRDMKLLALKNIEDIIDSGKFDAGAPEIHSVLDYLAVEGVTRQVSENRRLINNFPIVRKEACKLLGNLGGENSKNSLIKVLLQDKEPMVKAEAAYALGKIGLNDGNSTSRAIAKAVFDLNTLNPDNNFAFAACLAFEKLAKANNGLTDPDAFQAVISISQGNYIKSVKNKANQVLSVLRQYK